MQHQKKVSLLVVVLVAVVATASTINTGGRYKNLKVLPQDISESKLDSIMGAYCNALNVNCDFCHISPKKSFLDLAPASDTLDFSLDNEMKENARRMIRMSMDINSSYFYFDSTVKPIYLNVVNCNTCHRGNALPLEK